MSIFFNNVVVEEFDSGLKGIIVSEKDDLLFPNKALRGSDARRVIPKQEASQPSARHKKFTCHLWADSAGCHRIYADRNAS